MVLHVLKRTVVIRNTQIHPKVINLSQVGENGSRKTTLVKPHFQLVHITHEEKNIPKRKALMQ